MLQGSKLKGRLVNNTTNERVNYQVQNSQPSRNSAYQQSTTNNPKSLDRFIESKYNNNSSDSSILNRIKKKSIGGRIHHRY